MQVSNIWSGELVVHACLQMQDGKTSLQLLLTSMKAQCAADLHRRELVAQVSALRVPDMNRIYHGHCTVNVTMEVTEQAARQHPYLP